MQVYCFIFGQTHTHPITSEEMRDYWIEVEAFDPWTARKQMEKVYGSQWAFEYKKEQFAEHYFPLGCYEKYKLDGEGKILDYIKY